MEPSTVPYLKRVPAPAPQKAWTVAAWGHEVSVSRATVNRLLAARVIKSITIGRARRITTSPAEFLSSREDESAA
jgi:hypothetical protein